MIFAVDKCDYAFICGVGHGIGLSLVKKLLHKSEKINIVATYRKSHKAQGLIDLSSRFQDRLTIYKVDPTNDKEISDIFLDLKEKKIQLDLLINSVGFLHDDKIFPEKKLQDFSIENALEVFKVNALITPLLAKYFGQVIKQHAPSAFISISAKVGSIEDNRMGGWYSYRSSKAALNMMIKNISIEFTRRRYNCTVLAIHPGTTHTELSEPFIKNTPYILHSPDETAENILNVIDHQQISDTGRFLSWNKEILPW